MKQHSPKGSYMRAICFLTTHLFLLVAAAAPKLPVMMNCKVENKLDIVTVQYIVLRNRLVACDYQLTYLMDWYKYEDINWGYAGGRRFGNNLSYYCRDKSNVQSKMHLTAEIQTNLDAVLKISRSNFALQKVEISNSIQYAYQRLPWAVFTLLILKAGMNGKHRVIWIFRDKMLPLVSLNYMQWTTQI
jgi:hypothetical protein